MSLEVEKAREFLKELNKRTDKRLVSNVKRTLLIQEKLHKTRDLVVC